MEKYERKIKVKRELTTIDTNNDGVEDAIAYLNKDDLFVSVILKQTIKDLGVYTDYQEEPEIVDLGNFWETTNDGTGDGGINPISDDVDSGYNNGDETLSTVDNLSVYGCTDPNALNYNENAELDDGSCDYGGIDIGTPDPAEEIGGGSIGGGCFRLTSGIQSLGSIINTYTPEYMTQKASEWCQATHPSCGGNYPILNNCTPNGCGGSACCPGPVNTNHLLTINECQDSGFNCNGEGCNCQGGDSIFGGIKYNLQTFGTTAQITWVFYCTPN